MPNFPYLYNEPGIGYNDPGLSYGGTSYGPIDIPVEEAPTSRKRYGGGRSSSDKPRINLPWIDITVTANLLAVNSIKESVIVPNSQVVRGELSPRNVSLIASRTVNREHNLGFTAAHIIPEAGNKNHNMRNINVMAESISRTDIIIKTELINVITGSKGKSITKQ